MDYQIREIKENEYPVLSDFLYEAIFIPAGMEKPLKSIIEQPELQVYIADFGKKKDDFGFVALIDNKIVGAVWARIMNDYGHIDNDTPSLALAVYEKYRRQGIGTFLMKVIMNKLKSEGYYKVSLSVQRANPAFYLYERLGFKAVDTINSETEEVIMQCIL